MRSHNHYGYDIDVEQMTDSNPRSREKAFALAKGFRVRYSSPYAKPNIVKAKTTKTKWNSECQDRFFKAVQQLGGIDKSSPEAVLALMNNNNDLHRLDIDKIAHQIYFYQLYFKKVEAGISFGSQQENPNKKVTIKWTQDRITRFVGVVNGLGGVNKVSPQEILEAMKEDINDSFCLTVDEIAEMLCNLSEASLKERIEERKYGPIRRSMRLVRSEPYGPIWNGPKDTGSTSRVEFSWTLDRHKRFVNAVEMLGGVERANYKEILEVMKEEGLTRKIVLRHLKGLRRLLRGTEIVPISDSNLFYVHGTNGNGSNNTPMPAGDQAKVASSWSNSGSFDDVLNNFRELNLKPM